MRVHLVISMLVAGLCLFATEAQAQICGNGIIEPPEQCDDGSNNSDLAPDACRTDCTLPHCGDSVTDTGEECDNGPWNSDLIRDRCRTNCDLPFCGDGTIDSGEQCDDGGASQECSASCELEAFLFCTDNLATCQIQRDQCELDLNACRADSVDADADGEHDVTDQCLGTLPKALVDNGGCSITQFCALTDTTSRQGKRACEQADWRNDEPIDKPRDCMVVSGRCVPR